MVTETVLYLVHSAAKRCSCAFTFRSSNLQVAETQGAFVVSAADHSDDMLVTLSIGMTLGLNTIVHF